MLSWVVKYLADNPRVQNHLRELLHKEFPEALAAKRNPTSKEITDKAMPYMDAVIEESLRCACTTPSIDRVALVDTEILGYRIPKGTTVAQPTSGPSLTMPAFAIDEALRSPSSVTARREGGLVPKPWNPEDISQWKPERWLVERENGQVEFDRNAGPQVGFGLGTRGCFGQRFANVKSKVLIILLVWNYELQQCAPQYSRYTAVNTPVNTPRQCFVRLRELHTSSLTE
jgi:cytochrome P450